MFLSVTNVSTFYGRLQALHSVSVTVAKGETVAILGANGAGKSTLMQTIIGLLKPAAGTVRFDEIDITRIHTEQLVDMGIALVPERRLLFTPLTVQENLVLGLFSQWRKISADEKKARFEEVFELFPILSKRQNQLSATLSGGEQQMLAIGRALMSKPKLLLLDEPFMGLAPIIIDDIMKALRNIIANSDMSIVITEQHIEDALSLSDRGYVMRAGVVVREAASKELMAWEDLSSLYL